MRPEDLEERTRPLPRRYRLACPPAHGGISRAGGHRPWDLPWFPRRGHREVWTLDVGPHEFRVYHDKDGYSYWHCLWLRGQWREVTLRRKGVKIVRTR